MRKLIWIALGMAGAMALCAYGVLPGGKFLLAGGICAGLALIFLLAFRGKGVPTRLGLILLGCALAVGWYARFEERTLRPAAALDGRTETVKLRITDYSYPTDYGQAAEGRLTWEGKTYRVKAYLNGLPPLAPGDCLEGNFRFRLTARGGEKDPTYHSGRGILLLVYQRGKVTQSREETTWRDYPAQLRARLKAILADAFPADTVPFAKALLLGDTSDFDYVTDTSFKVSGIRHVVAVSGLHVSILFALLSMVTFHKRFLTALAGYPLLFLFAALAGFTPSITRSCLMFSLVLLAMLLERDYDGPTALAFSVVVMLFANPLTVTDVGFQLSVASVAGIYLFSTPIGKWITGKFHLRKEQKRRRGLVRWLSLSVSVSLSATVMTVPLCAYYFGVVSLVGVVTNLLALWVIGFIFYGLLAVCLLGFFWPMGAALAARLVAWPIRYVLFVARAMAKLPFAAVYTRSVYVTAWLVFLYALLLIFYLGKRRVLPLAALGTAGLCAALFLSWYIPRRDSVRFTVLDVGQGQCLLLQCQGRTYLVDCGGDSDTRAADTAAEALLSQGITHLDAMVLTHLDRDHAGAAENLLSRVDTDILVLPPEESAIPGATRGDVFYATSDLKLTFPGTAITVYTPDYDRNSNENSLCILFDTEKCDILITGDRTAYGERRLVADGRVPEVDVLMAGHHGSKKSTCQELLDAVRPKTVCISVSATNSYGHPAQETLERLEKFGCAVCRTDESGDILIRR